MFESWNGSDDFDQIHLMAHTRYFSEMVPAKLMASDTLCGIGVRLAQPSPMGIHTIKR
jgi:hypothetical protein